ncbi:MAG: hypothetical protein Q4F29_10720, partial [Lachnospiraceae bacterium]|nr:hypothetical protein [Lachnospiraceae bacterium]
MELYNLKGRKKEGYTTWGCIWPKGEYQAPDTCRLYNEDGETVPMQSRVTAYWPDGSVKWTAHTADSRKLTERIRVERADEAEMSGTQAAECGAAETKDRAAETECGAAGREGSRSLQVRKLENGRFLLEAGSLGLEYQTGGSRLFQNLTCDGRLLAEEAVPVLILEKPGKEEGASVWRQERYQAEIRSVELEEEGPLFAVLRYEGIHVSDRGEKKLPFVIRMKVGLDSGRLDFVHTFFYDGEENQDFLKGLGVRFTFPMEGKLYNRHVKAEAEHGCFHETAAQLLTWRPRVPQEIYDRQQQGERLQLSGDEEKVVNQVLLDMPFWDTYEIFQDSVSHFGIRKKVKEEGCCYLDCLDGSRTHGAVAVGSEAGSLTFAIRDFWEKYPSGYTLSGLTGEKAEAVVWLWSPEAKAMDFRHYAVRGYNQVYYEGYDFKGADPVGIACTSEFSMSWAEQMIPSDQALLDFSQSVNHPAQYVGAPEYYHKLHAFGRWSLPSGETETERWLEEQLDRAVEFYKQEVKNRQWYGMFNYGDFMHTYDKARHQWRYDMGGYAWDNTELVPTLWLWLYFMRTGREDVFELAEKLSRHASEVDIYHFGRYQGMGSRHNVRHWGCPCKEARIAMAAHHRFFYYMTGDYRMGEIFEELKDNEKTFLEKDPLEAFYPKEEMVYPSHARSGPDWSSMCANWMTRWERYQDETYKNKIMTGIRDIAKAPLRLVSGPDFEFDPATTHLRYIGERAAGGTHLQICMGAPQVWMELAELLGEKEFSDMLAEYGWFYYLPREKQVELSKGILGDREFSLPFMAAAMGAYGAWYRKDKTLAKQTWAILLGAMMTEGQQEGFQTEIVENAGNQKELSEIPWISTNFTAQWCLNVIMTLEFIRAELPKTMAEAGALVAEL